MEVEGKRGGREGEGGEREEIFQVLVAGVIVETSGYTCRMSVLLGR